MFQSNFPKKKKKRRSFLLKKKEEKECLPQIGGGYMGSGIILNQTEKIQIKIFKQQKLKKNQNLKSNIRGGFSSCVHTLQKVMNQQIQKTKHHNLNKK